MWFFCFFGNFLLDSCPPSSFLVSFFIGAGYNQREISTFCSSFPCWFSIPNCCAYGSDIRHLKATDVAGLTTAIGNMTFLSKRHCACTKCCNLMLSWSRERENVAFHVTTKTWVLWSLLAYFCQCYFCAEPR